jgi:Mrp family chromosome partitioning ATPase
LITMTVPSFNRQKVAAMANGLAQSFITEYSRLSAEEAHRSVVFLDKLVAEAENGTVGMRLPDKQASAVGDQPNNDVYRRSPLLEHLAGDLATREATLAQLSSQYEPSSPAVQSARASVDKLRSSLDVAERQEVQKLSLEQLRLRRYQAANTEKLFRDGLVPISIVEAAETPKKVSPVTRYLISGGVGLVLGLMLGLSLIVVLSVSDQRLYTSWDVERAVKLPMLTALPNLTGPEASGPLFSRFEDPATEDAFVQLLGRLDPGSDRKAAVVVAIASATAGEGKTFVAAGLAALLARGGRRRVLMIDADLRGRSLSAAAGANEAGGFIDAIRDGTPLKQGVVPTPLPGVDLLPAGHAERRAELGFYRNAFEELVNGVRADYDFILIDTTAVLAGNETMMGGAAVDALLLVTSAGSSRRPLVRAALRRLTAVGLEPTGVVLNRRHQYLPAFVWRNV